MKATNHFRDTIKAYLDKRAEADVLFSLQYSKPEKSLDECITYVLNYVKNSGMCGFEDSEIYSLALHYYDEDGLDVGKPINCDVIVNHTITLTEAEKSQARRDAMAQLQSETYHRMKQPMKKQQQIAVSNQKSLFDL